jgi:flagellar biosynthetic protein FlhB
MAEESDLDKTEPATPRRLEKAREEGQVVRSRELNTFLLLVAGVGGIWIGSGSLYRSLHEAVHAAVWLDPRVARDTGVMLSISWHSAFSVMLALLPLFALLVIVAVLSSVLLGGFLLSGKALAPKFERLNPVKGVARLFSAQTAVELVKTLAKAGLIGTVGAMVIWHYRDQMVSLMYVGPTAALIKGLNLVALCCLLIVGSLVVIVLIDAPWQIWSHHKKLRMSREDVKQENKESEGDPHVKGRIRQQQRAMARRRMMTEVPDADVVVTNPTHYAVALVYKEGQVAAPRVVAKGSGLVAARIRQLAGESHVPMLSAPPLARALYHHVDLGGEIPAELYAAVAQVLAWVYQLRRWNAGAGREPERPAGLDVPADMDPGAGPDAHAPVNSEAGRGPGPDTLMNAS